MTTARVIVTRPEPDAGLWVRQLAEAGLAAEALPLIEIAALSSPADAQALARAWDALDGYDACMFVSGHAVHHFFRQKRPFSPALRFMAPGPGTVAALRGAGVPAGQIDAPAPDAVQFDSEALWQVIGRRHWQGRRVLVVRGQGAGAQGATSGRDWLSRQWREAGAQVDFVGAYQRRAPALAPAQIERARLASADGSVWLFSSSEALANLAGLAELRGIDWRRARAVATHPRIVQAVQAAGWGVVAASRPALGDIRQALGALQGSLEWRHP